jgi:hypothetical protein
MPTVLASTEPDDIRKYRIIDCHEHIQSIKQAEKGVAVRDRIGIEKIVLVGSPWFTITMNEKYGFARNDWNNNQLLEIMEKYQGRFEAWQQSIRLIMASLTENPDKISLQH